MKFYTSILIAIALSGCTGMGSPSSLPKPSYPASLFKCLPKPDPNVVTNDNELGIFIMWQDAVIDDCKERLNNVGEMLTGDTKKKD